MAVSEDELALHKLTPPKNFHVSHYLHRALSKYVQSNTTYILLAYIFTYVEDNVLSFLGKKPVTDDDKRHNSEARLIFTVADLEFLEGGSCYTLARKVRTKF